MFQVIAPRFENRSETVTVALPREGVVRGTAGEASAVRLARLPLFGLEYTTHLYTCSFTCEEFKPFRGGKGRHPNTHYTLPVRDFMGFRV